MKNNRKLTPALESSLFDSISEESKLEIRKKVQEDIREYTEQMQKDVAKQLKQIRESAGMTQNEVAALLDVNQSYIVHLEKGNRNVSIATMARYANAVGKKLEVSFS